MSRTVPSRTASVAQAFLQPAIFQTGGSARVRAPPMSYVTTAGPAPSAGGGSTPPHTPLSLPPRGPLAF